MAKKRGNVLAVVGGQYGSEGKGVLVQHLAERYQVHVRVGGPNAGHSFYLGDEIYKMQSIPCGWINPDAKLIIGAGALVDPAQVATELQQIYDRAGVDLSGRLFIDPRATVLLPEHAEQEGGINGMLHEQIGSTGKGVGEARMDRMRRQPDRSLLFRDHAGDSGLADLMADTVAILEREWDAGRHTLLEGTQGSALSLIYGPWPYVTSADTNAGQMAVDAGIPPRRVNRTLLVCRTFPIRVAGKSGPMRDEISWDVISKRLGRSVEERTTVTNKVRRIAAWDEEIVDVAIQLNDPTSIALTFADYLSPGDEGKTEFDELSSRTRAFVDYVETRWNKPVAFVGTGGSRWSVVDRGLNP